MSLLKLKQILKGKEILNSIQDLVKLLRTDTTDGIQGASEDGANLIGAKMQTTMSYYDYNALEEESKAKLSDVKYYHLEDGEFVPIKVDDIPNDAEENELKTQYKVVAQISKSVSEVLNSIALNSEEIKNDVEMLKNEQVPSEIWEYFNIANIVDATSNKVESITLNNMPMTGATKKVSMYINGILYAEDVEFLVDRDGTVGVIEWIDDLVINASLTDKVLVKYFIAVDKTYSNGPLVMNDGTIITTFNQELNS